MGGLTKPGTFQLKSLNISGHLHDCCCEILSFMLNLAYYCFLNLLFYIVFYFYIGVIDGDRCSDVEIRMSKILILFTKGPWVPVP